MDKSEIPNTIEALVGFIKSCVEGMYNGEGLPKSIQEVDFLALKDMVSRRIADYCKQNKCNPYDIIPKIRQNIEESQRVNPASADEHKAILNCLKRLSQEYDSKER